jgi:glycerophosphoryl diester phosphodiesterase
MANLPLLLGHRGARASAGVVENTFASFDLALGHGCDGFEFDVRLAGFGSALVCHDKKVGKTVVAKARTGQLSGLPRLEEVVQRYGKRAFLDIELKVADLASNVLTTLNEYPPERGYVVSSFLPDVVLDLKTRSAMVSLGIICERAAELARWPKLPVDFVIVHHHLVEEGLVQKLQEAGLKILVWTVNEPQAMLRFAAWGVDGIISDETDLLVRTLRRSRASSA